MLLIEDTGKHFLRIVVDGQLESADYADFVPAFERLVGARQSPVPMLIELGARFSGWSLAGLWKELKFDIEHADRFGRIAVIGDERWQKWGTEMSNLLFRAQMRFFETAQKEQAEKWLLEAGVQA